MASRGLTTIQDASVTNGDDEWGLFHRLAEGGYLGGLRLFMMPGIRLWHEVLICRPPTSDVRLGPVKLMVHQRTPIQPPFGQQLRTSMLRPEPWQFTPWMRLSLCSRCMR